MTTTLTTLFALASVASVGMGVRLAVRSVLATDDALRAETTR